MRLLPVLLSATLPLVLAAHAQTAAPSQTRPAAAQEMTTLQHMLAKGIVVRIPEIPDLEIPVTYHPGGTFTAMNGQASGVGRIEGETLCAKATTDPVEACTFYPPGKKPGDKFEVQGPTGMVTIEINK